MYLTAHRVVSPSTGAEGINAFHYLHGDYEWDGPPPPMFLPETNPGTLFSSSVEVQPPGNRVRSFLDLVAQDGTRPAILERAVTEATAREVPTSFPATWTTGGIWFCFGLERALVPVWRHELRTLLGHVLALLENP